MLCRFSLICVIARRLQEVPKCPPSAAQMACFPEHHRLIFSCSIHLYANNYCVVGLHHRPCMEGASCSLLYIINLLGKPFRVKFVGEVSWEVAPGAKPALCGRGTIGQHVAGGSSTHMAHLEVESHQVCALGSPHPAPKVPWLFEFLNVYCLFHCSS